MQCYRRCEIFADPTHVANKNESSRNSTQYHRRNNRQTQQPAIKTRIYIQITDCREITVINLLNRASIGGVHNVCWYMAELFTQVGGLSLLLLDTHSQVGCLAHLTFVCIGSFGPPGMGHMGGVSGPMSMGGPTRPGEVVSSSIMAHIQCSSFHVSRCRVFWTSTTASPYARYEACDRLQVFSLSKRPKKVFGSPGDEFCT